MFADYLLVDSYLWVRKMSLAPYRKTILFAALWGGCFLLNISEVSAQVVRYVHTDGLGSPVLFTDENKAVVTRNEYEPYGATLNSSLGDSGVGYTGHLADMATGLTYMQQRYYDPNIGRFISADPINPSPKTAANFNRYKYAANNPYLNIDPDGRYECHAGKQDCTSLENAVKIINKAAEKSSSNSRVAQVSRFLGKPNTPNGVTITGNLANPKNLGEATRIGDQIQIGLNFKALNSLDKLGSITVHEASHGIDYRDDEIATSMIVTSSRSALNSSEITASSTQARMFEALGRTEPFNLFSSDKGMNWNAINNQADRSVRQLCPSAKSCSP
ncbi:RHS repeat domain-containing protein [Xanthomonas campestris]|uniref:RHS repeat domain-containing protein n=1 Tax=Xanthomonas campestris TaxID=339 RepID=UPI002367C608|nr:RHS repeat-associated core domain-containing protein [Xanthomonas campestris]